MQSSCTEVQKVAAEMFPKPQMFHFFFGSLIHLHLCLSYEQYLWPSLEYRSWQLLAASLQEISIRKYSKNILFILVRKQNGVGDILIYSCTQESSEREMIVVKDTEKNGREKIKMWEFWIHRCSRNLDSLAEVLISCMSLNDCPQHLNSLDSQLSDLCGVQIYLNEVEQKYW